jgi:pimeloyl-ACP methyl ester carboxylesterase
MNEPALSLHFGDVHLSTGVRLRYAETGDPAAHPLILLHGYSDSWFSWSRVLPALATGFHIYALDQRGHGDSDRPEQGYRMADFAADTLAFMDALDLPRATLVGHSMGTLVALQAALMAPERVARLVLIGAAASARTAAVLELEPVIAALEDPVPAAFVREFQASTAYQPLPAACLDWSVVASLRLPARVWKTVAAGLLAADYTGALGQIRAPALILWGERDTVFPRATQDALLAGLPHPRLKVYPETGHAPHWERPAEVVQDVYAFLQEEV